MFCSFASYFRKRLSKENFLVSLYAEWNVRRQSDCRDVTSRDRGYSAFHNEVTHSRITSACFYQLRRLHAVWGQLGQEVTGRLVLAFILSRLDYCSAILAGLPASTLAPLQRVMLLLESFMTSSHTTTSLSPILKALHWFPVKHRIEFKLCLLVHLGGVRLSDPDQDSQPTPLAPCVKLHPTADKATFRIPHSTHRSVVTFCTFHSALFCILHSAFRMPQFHNSAFYQQPKAGIW